MRRCMVLGLTLLVMATAVLAGADAVDQGESQAQREESTFRLRVKSVDKEKGSVAVSAGEGQQVVHLRITDAALLGRLKAGDEVAINSADKTVSVVVKVPLELAGEAGKEADALTRAREEARELLCRNRLRQLGLALIGYAESYKGKFPPDLGALAKESWVEEAGMFVCPTKERAVPKDFADMEPEKKAKWVMDNTSYAYNGAGKKLDAPSDTVLVYEKSGNHPLPLVAAVFADGHVEVLPPEKWAKVVGKDPGLKAAATAAPKDPRAPKAAAPRAPGG